MSDSEDKDSKTEEASAKKLQQARDQGNVPQSAEIRTLASLVSVLVIVWMLAPLLSSKLRPSLGAYLEQSAQIRIDTEPALAGVLGRILLDVGPWVLIPLVLTLVVGVGLSITQTGWMFLPDKLLPDLNKLNPLAGIGRLFSKRALIETLKNTVKLGVVGLIMTMVLKPHLPELVLLLDKEPTAILSFVHSILIKTVFIAVLCILVIAGADYFYQRIHFLHEMRMTKQEVKDEHKSTEGDPLIKSRIRSLQYQRSRQRMMQAVPTADVVVTNPTHYACALKYDGEKMAAPMLVAKGQDLIALKIRELATEHNVPIVENPPLARALYAAVDIDREIPPEHYKAVAEVISYVMRLKGKMRRGR